MNKLILNRKMYENIKRLDHREMQVYLSEIQEAAYKSGYEEAVKDTPTAAELIRAVAAKEIKGIGVTSALKLTHYAEQKKILTREEAAELYQKI